MVFESFFGDTLVKNDGTEFKTSDLSAEKGGVIGIYFSAHWCPPCRGFTSKLASIYNELKDAGRDFEIVFVSWDKDEESFKGHHGEQPWFAIPYANNENIDAMKEKYQVRAIPCLVMLEADTGNTISKEGRALIDEHRASGFPFTQERLAELKKEVREKKEAALNDIADLQFLGKLATKDEPDKELDLGEVARKSEALAIAFMDGRICQGSCSVLPKLLTYQQELGKEKLSVIVVPLMRKGEHDFYPDTLSKMKDVPMIPRGDRAQAVVNAFKPVLKDIEAPHVLVVDARDEAKLKLIEENAARPIHFHGKDAFPWTEEAIQVLKDKKEALKQEIKGKQKNLEFFTPSDNCHIFDRLGGEVSLSTLQSKDVVGIYFSGRGRVVSPNLVEIYNKCKEEGKSFEIVYVSLEKDQAAFDKHYREMPWCALKFEDRSLRETLSDVFEVKDIPALILLRGDGEIIADNNTARSAISLGADYFPWGPEEMERGKADDREREAKKLAEAKETEEKGYAEQEAAGKIPLRRHKGAPEDMVIGVDHSVKFDTFSTAAAPSAVVPSGKKAWYEVTFIEGDGISQMGWATSEFSTCDSRIARINSGGGVGDCTNSWGFDGLRKCKFFGGSTHWGKEFQPNSGRVLGVAADMENGKILFGLDGDWGEPMGVAFENLDCTLGLFPAITGQGMKVSVNFGDSEMRFGPPDESFEKLKDVVGK